MTDAFTMRRPCQKCGGAEGVIIERGAQDCVYCASCDAYQYNAPRVETGKPTRTVKTTHSSISTRQRARILIGRANGRCEVCGASGEGVKPLHVAHLVSVDDGKKMNMTDEEINDDDNLCAMCDECNIGLGSETVPPRLLARILRARRLSANDTGKKTG